MEAIRRRGLIGWAGHLAALPARRLWGAQLLLQFSVTRENFAVPPPGSLPPGLKIEVRRDSEALEALANLIPAINRGFHPQSAVGAGLAATVWDSSGLVGYWFFQEDGPALQDRGLFVREDLRGRRLAWQLLATALAASRAPRVVTRTEPTNRASHRVMIRAGMTMEGLALTFPRTRIGALGLWWSRPAAQPPPTRSARVT